MVIHRFPSLELLPKRWLAWSTWLVAAYLLVTFVGWGRTLIVTEIWSVYHAGQTFSEQLQAIRGDLVHPPVMYLIERLWLAAFGQTDSAAKALVLVVNLPTFFLFTWLASRVTPYWRLASFLFLASYLQVGSTPNQVRMYGLGLLLTVVAMVLWERWRVSARTGTLVVWTLVAALLINTHLFGALMVVAFVAANWLCGPRRWAFTAAGIVGSVAFLPWLLYVYPVFRLRGLAANLTWVPKQLPVALGILSYGLLGEFPVRSVTVRAVLAFATGLVHLAVLLFAWKVAHRLWPPRRGASSTVQWFWAAALLAGLPLVLLFLFSVVVTPALHWRFVLGVLPAYWLLIVLVCRESGRAGRILLYGVVLTWVLVNTGMTLVVNTRQSEARQAALLVARQHQPADLILCEDLDFGNEFYWEWTHRLGRTGRIELFRPPAAVARLSVLPQTDLGSFDLEGINRVWFFFRRVDRAGPVVDFLSSRGFSLQKRLRAGQQFLLLFAP